MPGTFREHLPMLLSPVRRRLYGLILICIILVILATAATIPFYFESSSILYLFGIKKTLLRSGKIIGLITACLVILQPVFSTRVKFLDRIFALNNLMNTHRISGMAIAACALIHPVLVLWSEDMPHIPLEFRYWPEFVGLFLLVMILGVAGVAMLRPRIGIAFHRWRVIHRWTTFIVGAALFVHVLFVSESFKSGLPRTAIFFAIGFSVLVFLRARLRPWLIRKHRFVVSAVIPAARDAFCINIRPVSDIFLSHLPGQFGFLTLKSAHLSSEAHPFTIASAPSRSGSLEFVIRTCGDWTNNIGQVQPDDRGFVDGPYGLFTHLRCDTHSELIMIAGGIGITPMLSMIRFMADKKDLRKITLIWSNRTEKHVVFADEFATLEKRLSGLQILHVFTGEGKRSDASNRLDGVGLEKLMAGCSRSAAVFVCGPPKMMKAMEKALLRIGFARRNIFSERFSL